MTAPEPLSNVQLATFERRAKCARHEDREAPAADDPRLASLRASESRPSASAIADAPPLYDERLARLSARESAAGALVQSGRIPRYTLFSSGYLGYLVNT